MLRGVAAAVVLSSLCALDACAAKPQPQGATPPASSSSGGDAAGAHASREDKSSRREMTWDEYYVDVEQRARHAGGFVMWFNPPRLQRRSATEPSPGPQPASGNLGDSVH